MRRYNSTDDWITGGMGVCLAGSLAVLGLLLLAGCGGGGGGAAAPGPQPEPKPTAPVTMEEQAPHPAPVTTKREPARPAPMTTKREPPAPPPPPLPSVGENAAALARMVNKANVAVSLPHVTRGNYLAVLNADGRPVRRGRDPADPAHTRAEVVHYFGNDSHPYAYYHLTLGNMLRGRLTIRNRQLVQPTHRFESWKADMPSWPGLRMARNLTSQIHNDAGYLQYSAFFLTRYPHDPYYDPELIFSVGQSPGTNPTVEATWKGGLIASTRHQPHVFTGDVEVRVRLAPGGDTVSVDLTDIVATDGSLYRDLSWADVPLAGAAFDNGTVDNRLAGSFYGPAHQEVGGVFQVYDGLGQPPRISGAFGAVGQQR